MRQECQKMFLFSYLNFMHIGKIMYFDNLQNFLSACKSYFVSKKLIQFYLAMYYLQISFEPIFELLYQVHFF